MYDKAHSGHIAEAVHRFLTDRKLTLSLAESCTGGQLAAHLTCLPGASKYFLGSVVAYSNEMKTRLLQVPEELIQKHGSVSGEVVEAMCKGILQLTHSDLAIAVTGIAGPDGGTPQKPVGTIWAAIGGRGAVPHVWTFLAHGSRETIIEEAVNVILAKLLGEAFGVEVQ